MAVIVVLLVNSISRLCARTVERKWHRGPAHEISKQLHDPERQVQLAARISSHTKRARPSTRTNTYLTETQRLLSISANSRPAFPWTTFT